MHSLHYVMKKQPVSMTSTRNRCTERKKQSEVAARPVATTTTTTTFQSRPEEKTLELFTGDLVTLDEYDKKTNGRTFKVLAYVNSNACESGTLICVQATSNLKEKYTLDRHWLLLHERAVDVPFDDDIPF